MRKCKKGKPCAGVERIHHDDYGRVGLFVTQTFDKETEKLGAHVGYRFPRGSIYKGFIWLNYCPWCGVDQRECGMVDTKNKRQSKQNRPSAAKEQ